MGVPDPRNCLWCDPASGATLALDEIVAFLAGSVATYKLPEELSLAASP